MTSSKNKEIWQDGLWSKIKDEYGLEKADSFCQYLYEQWNYLPNDFYKDYGDEGIELIDEICLENADFDDLDILMKRQSSIAACLAAATHRPDDG